MTIRHKQLCVTKYTFTMSETSAFIDVLVNCIQQVFSDLLSTVLETIGYKIMPSRSLEFVQVTLI